MRVFPDIFPEDFCEKILPAEAKHQNVPNMYRIIKNGKINRESFISTAEETKNGTRKFNKRKDDVNSCEYYSTSFIGNVDFVKQLMNSFRINNPKVIVAVGQIKSCFGPSISDKELNKKEDLKQHYHCWIYKDATPEIYFEEEEDINAEFK